MGGGPSLHSTTGFTLGIKSTRPLPAGPAAALFQELPEQTIKPESVELSGAGAPCWAPGGRARDCCLVASRGAPWRPGPTRQTACPHSCSGRAGGWRLCRWMDRHHPADGHRHRCPSLSQHYQPEDVGRAAAKSHLALSSVHSLDLGTAGGRLPLHLCAPVPRPVHQVRTRSARMSGETGIVGGFCSDFLPLLQQESQPTIHSSR